MNPSPENPTPAIAQADTEPNGAGQRVRSDDGSVSGKPYDPLNSLESEVERFMRTNLFTPMEVTGFYLQARCVINELKDARIENEYLRNVRERQAAIIRRLEANIVEQEEEMIALSQNNQSSERA